MDKRAAFAVLALLGAGAAVAVSRRQELQPQPGAEYVPDASWAAQVADFTGEWIQNIQETVQREEPLPQTIYLPSQLAAMRATVQQSEGTASAGDPYRVCYAYRHTIASMSDHPANTGEWRGETLPDGMCAAAGFGPGCVSTAAGAYQIIRPTWNRLKAKLGLRDFSPASQDAACDELLRERGAIAFLQRGDFAGAVNAARKEWASLPGAGYSQGERSIAWLTERFAAAGGQLA